MKKSNEPVYKVLSVAPSAYRRHAALLHEPHQRCARAKRDEVLMPEIERVWQANRDRLRKRKIKHVKPVAVVATV